MSTNCTEPEKILERAAFDEFNRVYEQYVEGEAEAQDVVNHEEALELASSLNEE